MKNLVLLVLFVFLSLSVRSQEQTRLDFSYADETVEDVLLQLEEASGLSFFYLKNWLPKDRFSGEFKDAELEDILDDLFQNTVINYYIMDDRVILTENSIIYDNFSQGFLKRTDTSATTITSIPTREKAPIFYEENVAQRRILTYKIGRENTGIRKRSYSLSGNVIDVISEEPLSNVAILVENERTGTATDVNGNYTIQLSPGEHLITTQSLGNASITKRVIIYNDGSLDFQLDQDLEQLSEVLLDSKSNENVKEVFTGTSQIDVQRIKTIPLVLGERDLLKVAATLPGISKAGEGSLGYNVRGGREDQNLILLDNGLIYNPNHFFGIFSALNPFTTGSVDIYKGSIPTKFGGRLSSVFDIKTKKGNPNEFSGEGSIGPVTGNLALEIPIVKEKSSLIVGGRATYSDWILNALDDPSLSNSEASFYDVIAKYNHQFDAKNELNATAYFSNDQYSITSDSLYRYQNRMFSLTYDRKLNSNMDATLIFSNSNYDFNIDYNTEFANSFTSGYIIKDSKIKLDIAHEINKKHTLNYGLSSKYYVVDPGKIEALGNESLVVTQELAQEKGLESAIYFSDAFEVNEKLLINGGLRFSIFNSLGPDLVNSYAPDSPKNESSILSQTQYGDNEFIKTYSGLEYRLAARYFLLEDFSIKAGYSSTLQYIHTLSNNTTAAPTDIYKLSDANIVPQKATQYSIGFFKNFLDNEYELSLEGYYKASKDLLDFETGATLFLNENIETETLQGEGKSYGAEVLLRKNFGDLNGWLGYTYSRSLIRLDSPYASQRVNEGEYFASNFDKPHDFSAILNYKLTQRFSFSANLVYQTGRPVTYPIGKYVFNNAEYVVYSERNKFRIPDYYRLDLSFSAEGNHKIEKLAHSFWNISVYNVLGRNNPYSVFFVTTDGEVKAYQSSVFSVPIPTITYNFKF
ncbi:carboxypeptidase-like regulatory domain-containing protein [Gramella sp. AN32]|uniref:Carboxypeptidase-like regulatory domain-containing protein n=1 Tax=Christiangramia antarctica TaxID=2058158 RepID=A0ABW5X4S5_9FLAO|nr:carboxypeptidase-like regulatory domain-containing protein [Gramella sp. AN32]MCM4156202.1 TonB-dependent receptor [Gramella sp. AN32]